MKELDHGEYLSLMERLVEAVEDFLDEKGITIDNPEKEENPDASNIYGSDYYDLEERFGSILKDCELIEEIDDKDR